MAPQRNCRLHGFTLVEMAMVLLVIGLVILIVYPALNAVRVSAQRGLTDSNLQALLRATAVYVQSNGCLPCPTPASTTGTGFGRVRGDTGAAVCSSCAQPEGIAPFVSLGIPESTAHDGSGHWITMRVDPALTANPNSVIPPTAPCQCADFLSSNLPPGCLTGGAVNTGCITLGASQKGLCRSGLSNANRISVQTPGGSTQQAAVIFASHGANGYGALIASALAGTNNGSRLPFPAGTPACASGGNELCNAGGTTLFVNASQVLGGDNPFDDSLTFMDRNNLISLFGNGSCQTAW